MVHTYYPYELKINDWIYKKWKTCCLIIFIPLRDYEIEAYAKKVSE